MSRWFALTAGGDILLTTPIGGVEMECKQCGGAGPFYDTAKDGKVIEICKPCARSISRELCAQVRDARGLGVEEVIQIKCRCCKLELPSIDFAPNQVASHLVGFTVICRECLRPAERLKWERRQAKYKRDDYSDLV
jgi:hypothetical protein